LRILCISCIVSHIDIVVGCSNVFAHGKSKGICGRKRLVEAPVFRVSRQARSWMRGWPENKHSDCTALYAPTSTLNRTMAQRAECIGVLSFYSEVNTLLQFLDPDVRAGHIPPGHMGLQTVVARSDGGMTSMVISYSYTCIVTMAARGLQLPHCNHAVHAC